LAISLGTAMRHLGRYGEAELWADRSAAWFDQTPNAEPWLAKVELLRAIILFDKHMHGEALRRIPALLAGFERLGMSLELQRCRLLHALLLKDVGRREEALNQLTAMQSAPEVHEDPLVHGLTLSNIGEILSSQGQFEAGVPFLSAAVPLLERAATPWAFANLQATIAETLREQFDIAGAIAAYQRAISIYAAEGMDGKAGYLRVLLAQLLGVAGRDSEAIQELLVALPLFEREAITPDALAAVALLRESLRRQKTDPDALRTLRLQIQKMKEVEQ
jgi:tetratricopeptide (TPR) repeat protein